MNAKLGLRKELRNLLAILIKQRPHRRRCAKWLLAYRAEMQERQGIRSVEIVTARELSEKYPHGADGRSGQTGRRRDSGKVFKLDQIHPRRNGGCALAPRSMTAPFADGLERLKEALLSLDKRQEPGTKGLGTSPQRKQMAQIKADEITRNFFASRSRTTTRRFRLMKSATITSLGRWHCAALP